MHVIFRGEACCERRPRHRRLLRPTNWTLGDRRRPRGSRSVDDAVRVAINHSWGRSSARENRASIWNWNRLIRARWRRDASLILSALWRCATSASCTSSLARRLLWLTILSLSFTGGGAWLHRNMTLIINYVACLLSLNCSHSVKK